MWTPLRLDCQPVWVLATTRGGEGGRKRLLEHGDGLVDLGLGDDQRGHEPDGRGRHGVQQHAARQRGLEHRLRHLAVELDGEQQAAAAHLADGGPARAQGLQALAEVRPSRAARAGRSWASTSRNTASAAAQASGFPPKVVPWSPGSKTETASLATTAPMGMPPPRPLASVMISGSIPNSWCAQRAPQR